MIVCILGRQPELGRYELSHVYGRVTPFGPQAALVPGATSCDVQALGGTQKAGRVLARLPHATWGDITSFIHHTYLPLLQRTPGKHTLGISAYGTTFKPAKLRQLGLMVKQQHAKAGGSLRLVPQPATSLNTAISHHNKLGLSPTKHELLLVQHGGTIIIAESCGAQNITALARRDQGRPKRDAFVGMLPPKLALMMVNIGLGLAGVSPRTAGSTTAASARHSAPSILDPFCGTGVVLQEAYLRGCTVYGTDLNPKMVDYSQQNLQWLARTHSHATGTVGSITAGDATSHTWPYAPRLSAVVCETYLGQPFSAPPSPAKLRQVHATCLGITRAFLANLAPQLTPGMGLCIAVPAWRTPATGHTERLPLARHLAQLGYQLHTTQPLLYYRADQIVARDIYALIKK